MNAQPLTPEYLANMKKRFAVVSSAPWTINYDETNERYVILDGDNETVCVASRADNVDTDFEFVAACRYDLPALHTAYTALLAATEKERQLADQHQQALRLLAQARSYVKTTLTPSRDFAQEEFEDRWQREVRELLECRS